MLDLIRHGEADEFCAYYPQWKPMKDDIEKRYLNFVESANAFYQSIRNLDTAEFAAKAQTTNYSKALIHVHIKHSNPSIEDFLCDTIYLSYLCQLLGIQYKSNKQEKDIEEIK